MRSWTDTPIDHRPVRSGQELFPNEDETVWPTFNGEIYNFRELRSELESKGHRFRSHTDAEVVLHAYAPPPTCASYCERRWS